MDGRNATVLRPHVFHNLDSHSADGESPILSTGMLTDRVAFRRVGDCDDQPRWDLLGSCMLGAVCDHYGGAFTPKNIPLGGL